MPAKMAKIKFLLTFILTLNYFNGIKSVSKGHEKVLHRKLGKKNQNILFLQNLSVVELNEMMTAFRDGCQARFPATDDEIDGLNFGRFPDEKNLKVNV